MNSKKSNKISKNILQLIKAIKNIKTRFCLIKTTYAILNLILINN